MLKLFRIDMTNKIIAIEDVDVRYPHAGGRTLSSDK